jgi:transposase
VFFIRNKEINSKKFHFSKLDLHTFTGLSNLYIQAVIHMPFRKIDSGVKERAVQLIAEGWPIERVIEAFDVSRRSIHRWADNYEMFGSVKAPAVITGRPRVLNPPAIEGLYDLLAESPQLYLNEIAEYLAIYHDTPISLTALHDNLRELGLTWKIMRRAALERDDALRVTWLEDTLLRYTADEMVFLDESSKDGHTIFRKYGRSLQGERPVTHALQDRGTRYSILPAITVDGYIAVRVIEGSVDGAEFFDFVLNDLVSVNNP